MHILRLDGFVTAFVDWWNAERLAAVAGAVTSFWALWQSYSARNQAKHAKTQADAAVEQADAAMKQVHLLLRAEEREQQRDLDNRRPAFNLTYWSGNHAHLKLALTSPESLSALTVHMVRTRDGSPLPIKFKEIDGSTIELGPVPVESVKEIPVERVNRTATGGDVVLDCTARIDDDSWQLTLTVTIPGSPALRPWA